MVVETVDDDDLADRMWESNLRHGVQYTRAQRKTYGVKLHGRGLKAKEIADRTGVGVNSVYRWTKEVREHERQDRDEAVKRLADEGKTHQEISEESDIPRRTVTRILGQNPQMVKMAESTNEAKPPGNTDSEPKSEVAVAEEPEVEDEEAGALSEESEPDLDADETPADESLESGPESEGSPSDETPEPELEPALAEEIPDDILSTARTVMGAFAETRPDEYVARLEASPSEWMTITDDSLSNELERELLTSAAAMCLWQEWMIWYQGEGTSAFTDAFGKIGDVFVRGQSGQWRIVSRLRSMLRRLWT